MAMSIGARQRMEANRAATRVAAWEKGRKERKELKERAEIEANMRDTVAAYGAVRVGLAATRMAAAHRGRAARREAEYNRVLVNIRVVDRERKQRLPDSGRCYIVADSSRGACECIPGAPPRARVAGGRCVERCAEAPACLGEQFRCAKTRAALHVAAE